MPLVVPRLDDRSFDDLVAEMLARIPAHTPEWTDVRVGDPGRTLLELFAWLGDTILYRANLIPERQRLRFLQLLGLPLRPATPARGIVSLRIDDESAVAPELLVPRAVVSGPVEFETRRELTVLPGSSAVFIKRKPTPEEDRQVSEVLPELKELYGLPEDQKPAPYITTRVFGGGQLDPQGLDLVDDTLDASVWVAILSPTPESRAAMTQAIQDGRDGRPFMVSMGVALPERLSDSLEELPERRRLDFVWELSQARQEGERESDPPRYRTLEVIEDGTGGLIRDGVMRVQLTPGQLGAPSNDVRDALQAGVGGERPPRLDDGALASRLVAWLRLRPTEKRTSLPLSWVALNAVEVDQGRSHDNLIVGESTGRADQQLALAAPSVDATSFALAVEERAPVDGRVSYQPWMRVIDLGASAPDDRHYVLDAEAGSVRFGDGMRGKIPERGARIRVQRMRAGGGPEGNLPAGKLTEVGAAVAPDGSAVTRKLAVDQPLPTRGGRAAETIAQGEQRIPAWLRHRNRAVTEEDYRSLALSTPGVSVARVELLPRFKPHQRRSDVPGVVTVMVLPERRVPAPAPPNPRVDRPLLESVHGFLDARRPLGTELYVVGPEYVPLAASVAVRLREGAEREQTLSAVKRAIGAFLWPLPPGGPTGEGWPLGGQVINREVEVAIARVAGVAAVSDVKLFERSGDGWKGLSAGTQGGPQVLTLEPWQLPELLSVVVAVGDSAPGDPTRLPNPFADGTTSVAVPVVPEVC